MVFYLYENEDKEHTPIKLSLIIKPIKSSQFLNKSKM